MRSLRVTFTLFLVVSAAAAADVTSATVVSPVTQWTTLAAAADHECTGVPAGQRVCADKCSRVLLCMGGSLDPIEVEKCDPNRLCDPQEGACVEGNTECGTEPSNITCNALGMFPDPYDCTVYHICHLDSETSQYLKCESGWAYDPITTLCSKMLTDDVCTNLPIKCNNTAETGPFPGDPNIYYICAADPDDGTLYPELSRCEHDWIYNPETYSCTDEPLISSTSSSPTSSTTSPITTTGSSSSTTTSTPSSTPTSTSSSTTTSTPSSTTTSTSSSTTTSTPSSTTTSTPSSTTTSTPSSTTASTPSTVTTSTPSSSSSDTSSTTSSSTSVSTPSSTSSTTPPASSSTTSATPSVTPTSTTSSTSSSTTVTPPSPDAPCSTPTEIVPDPNDCLSYYQCMPTYKWMHVNCIFGFYFNREQERCVYGPCPYTLW